LSGLFAVYSCNFGDYCQKEWADASFNKALTDIERSAQLTLLAYGKIYQIEKKY